MGDRNDWMSESIPCPKGWTIRGTTTAMGQNGEEEPPAWYSEWKREFVEKANEAISQEVSDETATRTHQ
jgi:hypothetical protein